MTGKTPSKPATHSLILVVEDDEAVREVIVDELRDSGYRIAEAGDAAGALALGEAPALMVCDIGLPRMRGTNLVRLARERWPQVKVLFITGYGDLALGPIALDDGMALMTKPFSTVALVAQVRFLLGENGLVAG
jgi:DNA-binding response OmpR family regulator